ncbi:SusC/RagA family TonB-linked outer membrane protein [Flavobacterium sp.]|jgi:iron complex outermembrane receptor protein|uniref:SusC/RagA family TonB-linked outer membrane protein n=1 Tax=Flavobacterium sp. TaxID=239 RepID=UPI0037C05D1B
MKTLQKKLLLFLLIFPIGMFAQNTLKGVVLEGKTQQPLPSVSVAIEGTNTMTATDFDGNFTLSNLKKGQKITFSFIGFKNQTLVYENQSSVTIRLEEDLQELKDVVVIGYGAVKKKDATGTVELITSKDFNDGPVLSPQQLISGKVAGVSISSNGGSPGESSNINIRGIGSLSLTSQPLFVIDGVPIDGGVGGSRNPLNLINPSDIESMSVLKDASATAIYGSRGANGVIVITTKKGKNKEFKYTFNSSTTMYDVMNRVDVMSANQLRDVIALDSNYDDTTSGLLGTANTDWQDEIYKTAFGRNHDFSATGNAWGVPMRASLSYTNHDGILSTDNFERTTAALSFSPSFLDNALKVEINAKGNYEENQFANRGAIGSAAVFDPTQSVFDANSPFGGYFAWISPATNQQVALAPTNPVALLNLTDDSSEVRRFLGNVKADYNLPFFKDVTATVNIALDKSNSNGRNITSDLIPTSDPTWNGSRVAYANNSTNKLFDAYFSYVGSFSDKHNLNAVIGHSYQSFEYDNYRYDSENEEDGVEYEFIDKSRNVLLSYFGRVNYDFKKRYLFTATLRADASSKLNPEDRWGYFPSVALAWNVLEESFMKNLKMDNLKLRVGYGEVGNVNGLGDYKFLTRYTGSTQTAQYQFGSANGLPSFYQTYRPDAVNKDLKWEIGQSLNVGLDFGFWNNRLNGSVNAYVRRSKDLIANSTVDPFTNFSNQIERNIGDMENRGIEFALNLTPIKTDNFEWNINYNIGFNHNEVIKLPDNQPVGGISTGVGNNVQMHAEGEQPYSFFVYKQIYDASGVPIEGAFADLNGDGQINDSDKYFYNDPFADILMGINTDFRYKNWDMAIISRVSLGNYIYNDVKASKGILDLAVPSTNDYITNLHTDYLTSGFTTISDVTALSDHFIEDGSFFKIDNISIGYTAKQISKGVDARFYGSVQNVAVFTNFSGIDPEIPSGIDNNFYPRPRSFMFGVNFNF